MEHSIGSFVFTLSMSEAPRGAAPETIFLTVFRCFCVTLSESPKNNMSGGTINITDTWNKKCITLVTRSKNMLGSRLSGLHRRWGIRSTSNKNMIIILVQLVGRGGFQLEPFGVLLLYSLWQAEKLSVTVEPLITGRNLSGPSFIQSLLGSQKQLFPTANSLPSTIPILRGGKWGNKSPDNSNTYCYWAGSSVDRSQ